MVRWALEKAEEYLTSAKKNLDEGRLFVAAEETFRAIENSLEAMLYEQGIRNILSGKRKRVYWTAGVAVFDKR